MDELDKLKIKARILEQSLEEPAEDKASAEATEETVEEEKMYLTKEEALELIKEEASKQINELAEKLEEDLAGRTTFAKEPNEPKIHEPDYEESDKIVLTSKQIVDKGNYMNIKRLAILIEETADLIVGEWSDAHSVVAPEVNMLVKKYFTFLQEFVNRLPNDR